MLADSLAAKDLTLPIGIALGATFLFSVTGAMVAIRRHYDIVGVFVANGDAEAAVVFEDIFLKQPILDAPAKE